MKTSIFEFLQHLLKLSGPIYKVTEMSNEFFVNHPVFQEMINRLSKGESAVIPFKGKNETFWLFLQGDEQSLIVDYSSMKKFIIPYCVDVSNEKRFFVKEASELGKIGSELFTNGYFMFKSTQGNEAKVWDGLKLWLSVHKRKPRIKWEESIVNAYTLRSKFRNHVEMMEWGQAEQTLDVIREGHYVSDENYLFLTVELLVAQKKWKEIWFWTEFDAISGLHRIPKDVKEALLSAFYFVMLAQSDVNGDFQSSFEIFKANRYRLSSLLDTHLGMEEDHIYRIFAYESLVENNHEKLLYIKEQVTDETSLELIAFLETKFKKEEKPDEVIPPEEQSAEFLKNGQLDDAYLSIKDCTLSKEKVRIMSAIGFFTGSNDIQKVAYELLLSLSEAEQNELAEDVQTNAYLTFIKMANEGTRNKSQEEVQEDIEYTWNHWFRQVVEVDADSIDPLFELLYDQEKLPAFVWTPSMVSELGNQVVEIALTSIDSKKKLLLSEGVSTFISELVRDDKFPREMAIEVYGYSVELLLLHSKRNSINSNHLNRLIEGLLMMDIEGITKYWEWTKQWYDMTPMKVMIPHLIFTLELFYDYGHSLEELKHLWDQWTSTLLSGLSTLSDIEIRDWYNIGEVIRGEEYLLNSMREFIEKDAEEFDPLAMAAGSTIVIFTLRESSARRAAEQVSARNPNLKVTINVDTSLTTQAKTLASNSDIVVLVTTAMKHALYYGITPYLKKDPVYPKSSGTSSIISELERYFA
ncbi:protein DpdD [Bacillus sp. JJ1562]|uniref:protein DpdD n=1 Tax=Bacillus sp. JJ1562 TaxID=3122960 RepID=UPI003001528F